MFNIKSFAEENKRKGLTFHPEIVRTELKKEKHTKEKISPKTLEELKALAEMGKVLNERVLNYKEVKDSELDYLKLPKEYLEYQLTKEELLEHVDPIIIVNLNFLCKDNVNRNELTKWVLLGYNTRLAKRIVELSVVKEQDEFPLHPAIEGIKEIKNAYYHNCEGHRNFIESLWLPEPDAADALSPEELRKRMDPYTITAVKSNLSSPKKEEEAFRWILRGLPVMAAIYKASLTD